MRYATEGPPRSLFADADADAVKRLHPENPRLQRLSEGDRLVVAEPFADLPGVWREIPEATAVCARRGGVPSCRASKRPPPSGSDAGDDPRRA